MNACAVIDCPYVAESSFEDFLTCALHQAPAVLAALERGRCPRHVWSGKLGRPVIMSDIKLAATHLIPRPPRPRALRAEDCEQLRSMSLAPGDCHPDFDFVMGLL
jgi:hypothetical protein